MYFQISSYGFVHFIAISAFPNILLAMAIS